MSDQLSTWITVGLIALMMFAVWKQGRANPDDTGTLGRKMAAIDSRLKIVELSIEDLPTVKDVEGLRGDVRVVQTKVDSLVGTVNSTDAAVVRIEQHLLSGLRS